jgi:dihydrofolate synthase/folylpolyglutamate synthase
MTYEAAVSWLFSRFPSYQNVGANAYKPDLVNVQLLLKALGYPEKALKFVHIAGTNGKGSTSHILAALCQSHGLKTGIFTSPHLVDFRERVKIDGRQIPEDTVIHWVREVIPELDLAFEPSFFELTFALALVYFKSENCDICIVETGLGGRLDATNVITPVLSVITNIGLDHQNFLGNTRNLIAAEKAGIIKNDIPVLIAERDIETEAVFLQKAKTCNAELRWVDFSMPDVSSDLRASYQQLNLKTAQQAFLWMGEMHILPVDAGLMVDAFQNVTQLTDFRARFEVLSNQPLTIIDVAHNTAGVETLMQEIQSIDFQNLHLVIGASADKNIEEILSLLPKHASYYLCEFSNPRSRKFAELHDIADDFLENYSIFSDVNTGFAAAQAIAQPNDLILIFGSFFLIGDLLTSLPKQL